jgi:DNA repair exonuclease SbcCD ATPase subunit
MAKIIFKSIEYRNLLSTGNAPNKIILNKSRTTLVMGRNGEGKSTMLDALTFSLFGKPFRDVKLGQLINSVNGKQCVVSVEFDIGNKQYKVIRGLRPAIFEIYCDGVMLNQDAAVKDYQKILEQQILRLNHKTFTQVVILGAASFVPFMQLKTSQRREVVEDILDIRIFSVMNQLLKDRTSITKDSITRIEADIKVARHKVESQSAIIEAMNTAKTDTVRLLLDKITKNDAQIEQAQVTSDILTNELVHLRTLINDKDFLEENIQDVNRQLHTCSASVNHHVTHKHFFNDNDVCSTCSQEITEEYKQEVVSDLQSKIEEERSKITALEVALFNLKESLKSIQSIQNNITDKNIELSTTNSTITLLNKQNSQFLLEVESVEQNTTNVDEEKRKLKELASVAVENINAKNTLLEQRNLQDAASLLLKDTGIKTAIIREYLPVMNTLINRYLAILDTYIKFELDESFTETIKSRYRDEFTYASFSEGEKKKLDVAILFAWRQIAQMKNSVNTNLLILDEVFDGSLDATATDLLLQLLDEVSKDANIFVISHKGDILNDKFHSVLRIEKQNDFSVICK